MFNAKSHIELEYQKLTHYMNGKRARKRIESSKRSLDQMINEEVVGRIIISQISIYFYI